MSDVMQTGESPVNGKKIVGLSLGAGLVIWGLTAFVGQKFVPGEVPGTFSGMAWLFPLLLLVITVLGAFAFGKAKATGQGLAGFALVIALLSVGWFAIAALGSKWGFWHWSFGLSTMTVGLGQYVVFGATGLAISALLIGLVTPGRVKPVILGTGALLVSLLLAGRLIGLGAGAASVPSIHDIQTDWGDPVILSAALMTERGPESNPVRYGADAVYRDADHPRFGGKLIADIQEAAECASVDIETCEDDETPKPFSAIEPLLINAPRADVFAAAEEIARNRGWTIVTKDAAAGVLEATHTSPWWGFKDDVAIRIREAEGNTTRIDMRSISRVGGSDLGANARRVTAFLFDLDAQRYE